MRKPVLGVALFLLVGPVVARRLQEAWYLIH